MNPLRLLILFTLVAASCSTEKMNRSTGNEQAERNEVGTRLDLMLETYSDEASVDEVMSACNRVKHCSDVLIFEAGYGKVQIKIVYNQITIKQKFDLLSQIGSLRNTVVLQTGD